MKSRNSFTIIQLNDSHAGKLLPPQQPGELDAVSTKAEAGLYSEAVVIEEQVRQL